MSRNTSPTSRSLGQHIKHALRIVTHDRLVIDLPRLSVPAEKAPRRLIAPLRSGTVRAHRSAGNPDRLLRHALAAQRQYSRADGQVDCRWWCVRGASGREAQFRRVDRVGASASQAVDELFRGWDGALSTGRQEYAAHLLGRPGFGSCMISAGMAIQVFFLCL